MRRRLAAALLLVGMLPALPSAQPKPEYHLSLDQGRLLAAQALGNGKPELTLDLTKALLRADRQIRWPGICAPQPRHG